jgi:hypothetical protein
MPFALDSNPEISEISEAINYLLGNFGANLSADPNTGEIKGPTGNVIAYLYKYLAVKYADSADGLLNFGDSPTGRLYYGLRNSDQSVESTNPADYIWKQVAGGFGTTKFIWYQTGGGRQIEIVVDTVSPALGFVQPTTAAIDLDIITSTLATPAFLPFFQPAALQVARSGTPLTPSFTGVIARLYATAGGVLATFVTSQADSDPAFGINTWRIGNSSTTGYGDIAYNQITVGTPTDGGGYALWPTPTAMSGTPASLTVPVRFKNSLGVVEQSTPAIVQFVFVDQGQSGDKIAYPSVYQWNTSIPTITGTSTYTWASSTFSPIPSGWSENPGVGPAGFTLYRAQVTLPAAAGATTSTINWTTASVLGIGYSGDNGTSSRICFSRIAGNPVPTSGIITTGGSASFPSSGQSATTWGISTTWGAVDPNPSSADSLYQSDGIYNPDTNQTSWTTPYISSLKVGQLSAITVNTGTLTVNTTGYILGGQTAYNTGTGFFLGYSGGTYKFSIGSSPNGLSWDGSNLSIGGNSNIQITGNGVFGGAGTIGTLGLGTTAVSANNLSTANFGIITRSSNSTFGAGIYSYSPNTTTADCGVFLKQDGGFCYLGTSNQDILLGLGQIKFPSTPTASTDPNTLDTYVEGSWVPTFTNFGTVAGYTAQYVKIGKTVTFTLSMTFSAAGSSGSITRFTLPFNAAVNSSFSVWVTAMTAISGGNYQALAEAPGNSVQVSFLLNGASGTFFAGGIQSGSGMVFTGSYIATS